MKVNQKNKTRIGISLLCAIILLTGCHITPNKKQDGEKKKYPKLVVVYSDAYGEDSSFSQVQEEINKITRKKLGVEVEFHLISDSNYSDAVELMLTSGEQVDILWGSNSLFVKAYVNRQLCDLEPLLKENGKDIIDAVGWKYINCCRIGGTLYGLPNNRDFAAGWDSYALRKDILNKYNIKASDIKNIKDLEKVFDLVLEKENGVVPLACTGSLFGNFSLADGINSLVSGGHENYGQEDEVVDIFETEEYKNRLKQVRKWYLKGYMGDNILENTSTITEMIRNGEAFAETVKKSHSWSDKLSYMVAPKYYLSGHGMGSSAIAESYIFGGMFGVMFVGYMLVFCVIFFVEKYKKTYTGVFLLFFMLPAFFISPRSAPMNILPVLFRPLFMLFFIQLLFYLKQRYILFSMNKL